MARSYDNAMKWLTTLCLTALLWPGSVALAGEWSGYVSGEYRYFPGAPNDPRQHGNNLSLSAQPEYYHEWDNGRQSITVVPFARWNQGDNKRSHADIRELNWLKASDNWELRIGIGKVYWGVTESQHLVDIINQTDFVENLDGEDKLGQPMIQLALIRDWGTVDLFVLPGFRERTFAGADGRPRFQPRVDTSQTQYESSRKQRNIDYAARWSHYLGDWDFGLSYFHGTSRDPTLLPTTNANGETVLIPHYEIIDQFSLDLQATLGDWLWKLETIHRSGQGNRNYAAATGGFEYTLVGIFDSSYDLGLITEVLWDERGRNAPTLFDNDTMIGARFTLNDADSSELLLGLVIDNNDQSRMLSIEGSRRIGQRWKLSIEARTFANAPQGSLLYGMRDDDYLQLELARYF
ncbi:FIG01201466: hypothetical protein [hydrothermal vent metagenome]|uniref:Alginate export domain-containing protein n=1 Tax=hydrothermal vent metagenome TaxID=652676 RepID=A0A3B1AWP5_9ZZZZ